MTAAKRKEVGGVRRGLVNSVMINIAGQTLPALAALVCLPILVRQLGSAGYGVLALLFLFVGYMGALDFGIGKAATNRLAYALRFGKNQEVDALLVSTLMYELVIGISLAGLLIGLAPWLIYGGLKIPIALQSEALHALWIVGAATPVITVLSGLRGCMEAKQRFDLLNYGRAPIAVLNYVLVTLVAAFGGSLTAIASVLVLSQIGSLMVFFLLVRRLYWIPEGGRRLWSLKRWFRFDLFTYGIWLMLSDIAVPVMAFADRFMIGGLLSVGALGFYSAPYTVVYKLMVVPSSISSILFSEFSSHDRKKELKVTEELMRKSIKYSIMLLFPFIVFLVVYGNTALKLWLGMEFARHAMGVIPLLSAGVFFNALAHIPYTALRALGKPKVTVKVHIVEVPIYILALWLVIPRYGLIGVAGIWAVRMLLEAMAFHLLAKVLLHLKVRKIIATEFWAVLAINIVLLAVLFVIMEEPVNWGIKIGLSLSALLGALSLQWRFTLNYDEKTWLKHGVLKAVGSV